MNVVCVYKYYKQKEDVERWKQKRTKNEKNKQKERRRMKICNGKCVMRRNKQTSITQKRFVGCYSSPVSELNKNSKPDYIQQMHYKSVVVTPDMQ
jgi:hypothetical protein